MAAGDGGEGAGPQLPGTHRVTVLHPLIRHAAGIVSAHRWLLYISSVHITTLSLIQYTEYACVLMQEVSSRRMITCVYPLESVDDHDLSPFKCQDHCEHPTARTTPHRIRCLPTTFTSSTPVHHLDLSHRTLPAYVHGGLAISRQLPSHLPLTTTTPLAFVTPPPMVAQLRAYFLCVKSSTLQATASTSKGEVSAEGR